MLKRFFGELILFFSDINECSTISPCDPTLGLCHNARGSFYCTCRQGYKLDAKGILCEGLLILKSVWFSLYA